MKNSLLILLVVCGVVAAGARSGLASPILYTHDPAGRLTAANYTDGKSISHTYDLAGNLTSRQFIISTGGDSDNDGMDDAWEMTYFMTLDRDGTDDYDHDGMSDLAEFLAGTLPNNAASVFKIIRVTPTPGVSALIEWTSVPGKTYRVQYRNALNAPAWSDLPGDVTATTNTAAKVDPAIAGVTQRFYRVALVSGASSPPTSPILFIARTNSQILIAWPSSTPAGFSLETTTNLVPVIVWTAVTNVISDDGTNKNVLLNIDPQTPLRFFRLRQ